MSAVPICAECRFFQPGIGRQYVECRRADKVNPKPPDCVTGFQQWHDTTYCENERAFPRWLFPWRCGKEGRFWEPKEKP